MANCSLPIFSILKARKTPAVITLFSYSKSTSGGVKVTGFERFNLKQHGWNISEATELSFRACLKWCRWRSTNYQVRAVTACKGSS